MKIPPFTRVPGLFNTLTDLVKMIDGAKDDSISKDTANHSVLLQAPNKVVYSVTVSNTGVLTVTQVG